jgi:hypothetical protein
MLVVADSILQAGREYDYAKDEDPPWSGKALQGYGLREIGL